MTTTTIVYNVLVFVVDGLALRSFRARPLILLAVTWVVALVLALILGPGHFGMLGLLAYGLFGHGVAVLVTDTRLYLATLKRGGTVRIPGIMGAPVEPRRKRDRLRRQQRDDGGADRDRTDVSARQAQPALSRR